MDPMYGVYIYYDGAEFRRDAPPEVVRQVDLRCPKDYIHAEYSVLKNSTYFSVRFEHRSEDLFFDMEGDLSDPPETWKATTHWD